MSNYPVNLLVEYPHKPSRGLLFVRLFFAPFYLFIPHGICLIFFGLAAMFVIIISWFAVLFMGSYPRDLFNFIVNLNRWVTNVNAYFNFLTDVYPPFSGAENPSHPVKFNIEYPEKLSRGLLLLRTFFGWLYVGIPHGFCLWLYGIASFFISILAWLTILFTGEFPKDMFNFIVGYYRWNARVNAYNLFMTDLYPPFTGKE